MAVEGGVDQPLQVGGVAGMSGDRDRRSGVAGVDPLGLCVEVGLLAAGEHDAGAPVG